MARFVRCWRGRLWKRVQPKRRLAWSEVLPLCSHSANRNLLRRFCLGTCLCEARFWSTRARRMKPGIAGSCIRNTRELRNDGFVLPGLVGVACIAVLDAIVKMEIGRGAE